MSKSWKSTLKLPRSSFPARPNPKLQLQYLRDCTEGLYKWQATHRNETDTFLLHDGPPYANGPLHIGHAMNKILKDAILRVQVQLGRRVTYRPSWDCHGLPIEMKALGGDASRALEPVKIRQVAKRLAKKTMAEQMKGFQSFAVMADWENKWTTMDRAFEIRQLRVFQKMVRNGLIYRKRKPVYWSPSSRTALAEAELEYRDDHVSNTAYVKFPIVSNWTSLPGSDKIKGPLYAAIWTTTPWTLPANRAIAIHKNLKYAVLHTQGQNILVAECRMEALQNLLHSSEIVARSIPGTSLIGMTYRNRLRGKSGPEQPIVHADFVSAESGTGLVHMAPGHGQEDFEACSHLGIDAFAPITDDGHFTAEAYPDDPEKLTSASSIINGGGQKVLELMGDDILALQKLTHKYPYDWRTKQPVVVRATAQWFADVGSIKQDALQALKNVRFVPESGKSRLESFVTGRSEWCISRQRSWGVPIPALYDEHGTAVMTGDTIEHIISVMQQRSSDSWFSDSPEDRAWIPNSLSGSYRRGTDTMDVWFDSGSSWTEVDNPADVYLEGSDQHRGWFQSSLLTYVASQRAASSSTSDIVSPFKTLITHGFALDPHGRKMSKSLGNTVQPEQVMDGSLLPPIKGKGNPSPRFDALGADALRLWACSCDFTSDVVIGPSILQPIHASLIKFRTVLKMVTGSLHQSARDASLSKLDQIAMLQLMDVMTEVFELYKNFEFHKALGLINRWISADLSAFYLEALKDRLYCGDGGGAMEPIFVGLLRMLAPITPVLVEEGWSHRPSWMADDSSIEHPARQIYNAPLIEPGRLTLDREQMRQDWPVLNAVHVAVKAGLEKAREAKALGSSLQCSVVISTDHTRVAEVLTRWLDELSAIFVVSHVEVNEPLPEHSPWVEQSEFETTYGSGRVQVLPPRQAKCSRCWRYMAEEEDGLCHRCEDVVAALEAGEAS